MNDSELDLDSSDHDVVIVDDDIDDIVSSETIAASSQGSAQRRITATGRKRKLSSNSSWVWSLFRTYGDRVVCTECPSKKPATYARSTGVSTLKRHLSWFTVSIKMEKPAIQTNASSTQVENVIDPMEMDGEKSFNYKVISGVYC